MLERWTELFGYNCTSRKGPRIFIRDLLPTLDRASFLSGLPSFCLLLPLLLLLPPWLLVLVLLTLLRRNCQTVGLWAKRDAACSFFCWESPGALPSSHSWPHAPCRMPHAPWRREVAGTRADGHRWAVVGPGTPGPVQGTWRGRPRAEEEAGSPVPHAAHEGCSLGSARPSLPPQGCGRCCTIITRRYPDHLLPCLLTYLECHST